MNREQIYTALFAQLDELSEFVTRSRKLRHWNDVPMEEQPAVFVSQINETAVTDSEMDTRWTLKLELYVYARVATDQLASSALNPLVDAVCNRINRQHPILGKNCLGLPDVVDYCRVEGTIETDEGTLGDQAVAIIPVSIYLPD